MQNKDDLDTTCINTICTLSRDAVQAANSGPSGTPMALAPVAAVPALARGSRIERFARVWPTTPAARGHWR